MENRFKQRVSRLFRSSFGSCRSRNVSDVMERPVFVSQNRQHPQLIELFSPKPRPFPSICRNKCSQTVESFENRCIISKELFPRRKVSDRKSLLFPADVDGRKCPSVSPLSPLHTFYDFKAFESNPGSKEKKSRKFRKKKTHMRSKKGDKVQFDSLMTYNYNGWFSSDGDEDRVGEDDDETTLFSSKSLSSDSSDSFRRKKPNRRHKPGATRRRRGQRKESETGLVPSLQGTVKDSLAVVKRSSDPYNDFRTSMVEMIVERQIFSSKDLENLLQCFLSLNSYHHHRVILEVFTEIWEALFSDWF